MDTATGKYDKVNNEFNWEPVTWRKDPRTGLFHSNRKYPKRFWRCRWDKKPKDIAGVILLKKSKKDPSGYEIFIVQCYNDKWGFPKGKLNGNESFLEGAQREFYEESGTRLDLSDSLGTIKIVDNRHKRNIVFYLHIVKDDFRINSTPLADVEITAFGWLGFSRLEHFKLSNLAKKFLYKSLKLTNSDTECTPFRSISILKAFG